jgi:hypothetical protein
MRGCESIGNIFVANQVIVGEVSENKLFSRFGILFSETFIPKMGSPSLSSPNLLNSNSGTADKFTNETRSSPGSWEL